MRIQRRARSIGLEVAGLLEGPSLFVCFYQISFLLLDCEGMVGLVWAHSHPQSSRLNLPLYRWKLSVWLAACALVEFVHFGVRLCARSAFFGLYLERLGLFGQRRCCIVSDIH